MRLRIIFYFIISSLSLNSQDDHFRCSHNENVIDKEYVKDFIKKFNLKKSGGQTEFSLPVEMYNAPDGFFESYSVSAYFDTDTTSSYSDFDCGNRSKNDHRGVDFYSFPFCWLLYELDAYVAVCAADGIIFNKIDGNYDQNCSPEGNWNAVWVMHDDGSMTWYGHLKEGSLTSIEPGHRVDRGDYLGVIGSSGLSNGPHLHFQCFDSNLNLVDPFFGECNYFDTQSTYWLSQKEYRSPKMAALLTHKRKPRFGCPAENEYAFLKDTFYLGQSIWIGSYFIDYINKDDLKLQVLDPNGQVHKEFTLSSEFEYDNSHVEFEEFILYNEDIPGEWTLRCNYYGVVYEKKFVFVNEKTINVFPNPSQDLIEISGLDLDAVDYQIFSQDGKLVSRGIVKMNRVDLSNFPSGVYLLSINHPEMQFLNRVIKL